MENLGPKLGAGEELAVAPYPTCEEACARVQKWLQPPTIEDGTGFGIYDVYKTTQTEVPSTCKAMCWNTVENTGSLGNNNVQVAGKFFNHSMPIPTVSKTGIDMLIAGGLTCIAFVGCFTTCFKGRTKKKVLTAAEQKAKWEAAAKANTEGGAGVNKIKQAIADMTQAEIIPTESKGPRGKSARVAPTVGDPSVDHLQISMKGKRVLADLHRKRGGLMLPPIDGNTGAPHDDLGDDEEIVVPEEEEPETAAERAERAAAERKRNSITELL